MSFIEHLLKSYSIDTESYHKLVFLLTNNKINEGCHLDSKILYLLDQPLRIFEYSAIKETDDLEEHTKLELTLIINKLLEERTMILSQYENLHKERKRLQEENINLLSEIFELGPNKSKNLGIQILIDKFFLNSAVTKKYLEKLELKNENFQRSMQDQDLIIKDLTNQNNILRDKLIKSRETLRNYLINNQVPYNNDETLNFGPQTETKCSNNNNEIQDLGISGSFEKIVIEQMMIPNNKLQEWDKTSIFSQASRLGGSIKKLPFPAKIGSSINIEYDKKRIPMGTSRIVGKNLNAKLSTLNKNPKNLGNLTVSKIIKETELKKNNINDHENQVKSAEEKKELHKVASSKLKLDQVVQKGRTNTTNYLNVPKNETTKTLNKNSSFIEKKKNLAMNDSKEIKENLKK